MATGHRATGGGLVPELGRVAIAAIGVAGLVGLLVGPASARLFENVVTPGAAVTSGEPLGAGADQVSAVAHRKPPAPPVRLAANPATLAVEPAVRRATVRPAPRTAARTTASTTAAATSTRIEQMRAFFVEPVVTLQTTASTTVAGLVAEASTNAARSVRETRTKTASVSNSTTTVMFSIASAPLDTKKKAADKRKPATIGNDDRAAKDQAKDEADKGGAKAR
jgi:hypothetical protein